MTTEEVKALPPFEREVIMRLLEIRDLLKRLVVEDEA